jgi:hypothetical protein
MSEGKKFTQSEMDAIMCRLELFDYLKDFVDIDFNSISDKELDDVVISYQMKIVFDHVGEGIFSFFNIDSRYRKIKSESGYTALRKYFAVLQFSLIEKFEEVKRKLENDELLSFNGTAQIVVNPVTNEYETRYLPLNFSSEKEFDITVDCEILISLFFELLSYLLHRIPKGRLKICEKCGMLFFQITRREKIFCSPKCAKAAAQAEYIKKQKKEER